MKLGRWKLVPVEDIEEGNMFPIWDCGEILWKPRFLDDCINQEEEYTNLIK